MPGSVRFARLFGIDVRIHVSWLLIFFLVVLSLSDQVFPRQFPQWSDEKNLVVGAITAFLFFGSVLAHEFAHALVARRFHMSVSSITLFLLGGVANLTKEPPSAKAEFFMAIAGPAMSVALGVAGLLIAAVIDPAATVVRNIEIGAEAIGAVALYLGQINLLLAVFNLIPGFPLDGGRVLRAVVWALRGNRLVATRVAARGGQLIAGLIFILAGGLVFGLFGDPDVTQGLWFGLIAYFLYNAASASLQQERLTSIVGTVRVGQLMTTDFRATPPGVTVGALIRDLVLPMNLRAIPIVSADRLLGLVTIGDLRKVEQDRWSVTPVDEVMTRASELPTVSPEDQLTSALERFGETDLPVLPVVRDGSLVGLLHRESVIGYVRMREMLGLEGRQR